MIRSGVLFEKINEKIASLKNEIKQSGELGLTNIHKHCENFVKQLLNETYGYKLENLNKDVSTFPGLDLGDKEKGIAYQVTAKKGSDKVDDALTKVIRYKHYTRFKDIRVFILTGKQSTYSISVDTTGFFEFDWKKQIVDFDDLLRVIQNLSHEKIKTIYDFIEAEFPETIETIKHSNDQSRIIAQGKKISLINVEQSLEKMKFRHFEHWSANLRLNGSNINVPELYGTLTKSFNGTMNRFMRVIDKAFEREITPQRVIYNSGLVDEGSSNHRSEYALQIESNSIKYEYAQYQLSDEMFSRLSIEVFGVISLLLSLNALNKKISTIELDIDLSTNGNLIFMESYSLCKISRTMSIYKLSSNTNGRSFNVKVSDNETLLEIIESVLHWFIVKEKDPFEKNPFLEIDTASQIASLNELRNLFQN